MPMQLPVLRGERVTLRPLVDADLDALVAIVESPGVREWWPSAGNAARVREELVSDESTYWTFAIEVEGRLAGWLGFGEEADPYYRHASLDVYVDPAVHGRGVGTAAVRVLCRHLIHDHGHHRLTIDPAADNTAAIRCYSKVGFRPVGITRLSERGPDGNWHDGLLMDLLADEFIAGDTTDQRRPPPP